MNRTNYLKKGFVITLLCTFCHFAIASVADSLSQISKLVAAEMAEQDYLDIEVSEQNLFLLSAHHIQSQQTDGSWEDVKYSNMRADSKEFRKPLDRIKIMSADYQLTGNEQAAKAAAKAINHWYQISPRQSNWWWNQIGKQLRLGSAAIMLGDQLSDDLREKVVGDMPTAPKYTGANRTDISQAVIFGALITDNETQFQSGLTGIEETIKLTTGEGIQHDFSFQQHGPQLYTGGYGEDFFKVAAFWAYHVQGTPWSFASDKETLLSQYFLDGVRWKQAGGTIDHNAMGRGITRHAVLDNTLLSKQTQYIKALDPERAEEADAFNLHLHGGPSGLQGFRSFWRSDYASKVGSGHFIGIKMNSERIEPTESGNGENLLGYWLGFGSTFIMQRGDEYHNLFPVWNWRLVPGVTAPYYTTKPPGNWGRIQMDDISFVGSVSDGRYGVAVMDMDVLSTQAKKAWFSFDNELVALGAGISSTRSELVNTTVNQTRLHGPVTIDGQVYNYANDHELVNASWVHHDGVGYLFPKNWYGNMNNQAKTGSWYSINNGQSKDTVIDNVFTLRMRHGYQPRSASYAYQIVPEVTANETADYAAANPIQILSNSDALQAVHHTEANITSVVFHQAGELTLPNGDTISTNKPSILVVNQSEEQPKVILSTPGTKASVIVGYKRQGVLTETMVNTSIVKELLGKSVVVDFSKPYIRPHGGEKAIADAYVQGGRNANTNYGDSTRLVVKKDRSSNMSRKVALKFDLSNQVLTPETQAVLYLYVSNINSAPSRVINVTRQDDATWDESTITWNTFPSNQVNGNKLQFTITPEDEQMWLKVDVTALVEQGVFSLALENLITDAKGDVIFSSRETQEAPQLVLSSD